MGQFDGLGFQFGNFPPESLRVSGIDLDHVINENGDIEPFAEEIVNLMLKWRILKNTGT